MARSRYDRPESRRGKRWGDDDLEDAGRENDSDRDMRPGFGAYEPPERDVMGDRPHRRRAPERPGWEGWNDRYRREQMDHERGFMDRVSDEMASWFGDEAAEHRREEDHRGKGPRGYRRTDARIEEDVNDRLTEDPLVDATEISVTVKDAEVTLAGEVDSKRARRRAEDCADAVAGVLHVQNNLRVNSGGVATPE